ncbi:hypothetical protein CW663_09520 [Macrococcoides caseolyticum]|nr:hypothetical protein CW663_09520 [Macrococcus caseolyticus]
MLSTNPALHSLYTLEQTFSYSVLNGLNESKICVSPQWLIFQEYERKELITELRDKLPASKANDLEKLEQDILKYMSMNRLYLTTDKAQLSTLETLNPVYSMLKKLLKMKQFQKQWVEKLGPYYSVARQQIELNGHWKSYSSYTGRITASRLPLTSMPNKMKRHVVPSRSNCSLWSVDFSNAELRFLACYSGDKQLSNDLVNGLDVHLLVGDVLKKVLESSEKEIDHRRAAKSFIFAFLYGASNYRLNSILTKAGYSVDNTDVENVKKKIFARYPTLSMYFNKVEQTDTVNSFYGPLLPLVTFTPNQKRNFALQSSISTAIKLLAFEVTRMNLEIVHIIHDELWIQVPDSNHCSWQKDLTENFSRILLSHHSNFPVMGLLDIKKMEE